MVDDNPNDLSFLERALAEDDRPIRFCSLSSGDAMFSSLSQGLLPDIFVLDFNLPGKSGLEILKILRTHHHWRSIPILFLSGLFSPEQQKLLEEQNVLCLEKPFDLAAWPHIVDCIHDLMDTYRLQIAA